MVARIATVDVQLVLQTCDDGIDQPIAFATRSLIAADNYYSQLDKEASALVFGVGKCHQYLYGRCLPTPNTRRARVQGYDYHLYYKRGKDMVNADALSFQRR